MSPHILVDLDQLRKDLAKLNRNFRDKRNNERPLESRNKREGWRWQKNKRTLLKEWALRYRKQTGAQVLIIKERK